MHARKVEMIHKASDTHGHLAETIRSIRLQARERDTAAISMRTCSERIKLSHAGSWHTGGRLGYRPRSLSPAWVLLHTSVRPALALANQPSSFGPKSQRPMLLRPLVSAPGPPGHSQRDPPRIERTSSRNLCSCRKRKPLLSSLYTFH